MKLTELDDILKHMNSIIAFEPFDANLSFERNCYNMCDEVVVTFEKQGIKITLSKCIDK